MLSKKVIETEPLAFEDVFQLSQDLDQGNSINEEKVKRKAKAKLWEISQRNEVPYQNLISYLQEDFSGTTQRKYDKMEWHDFDRFIGRMLVTLIEKDDIPTEYSEFTSKNNF